MESKGLEIATHIENVGQLLGQAVCRLCSSSQERLIAIYSEEGITNGLSTKINLYLPVKVSLGDDLPLQCCLNCASTLLAWHELVLTTVESDKKFRSSELIDEKEIDRGGPFKTVTVVNVLPTPEEESIGSADELYTIDVEDTPPTRSPSPTPTTFTCPHCQTLCKTKSTYDRHLETHNPSPKRRRRKSVAAPVTFEDIADLETNTCLACETVHANRTDLKRHIKHAHNLVQVRPRRTQPELEPQFFCDVCQKGFIRRFDMERHKKRMHQSAPPTASTDHNSRAENKAMLKKCRVAVTTAAGTKFHFQCDFCERKFNISYNLTRHRTVHTGVRAYCCHICGKSFRISSALSRHINETHHNVRKFICELCNKRFATRGKLTEHQNVHTDLRPFICDVCGKGFRQKASLWTHKIFHNDVYKFECKMCEKKFRRAHDLKVHSWIHTGHKPYECPKCTFSTRLTQDLKRHMKTHIGAVEDFLCNECGCTFEQERYLNMHQKVHITEVVPKVEHHEANELQAD